MYEITGKSYLSSYIVWCVCAYQISTFVSSSGKPGTIYFIIIGHFYCGPGITPTASFCVLQY
jgi:hypothetical protein